METAREFWAILFDEIIGLGIVGLVLGLVVLGFGGWFD